MLQLRGHSRDLEHLWHISVDCVEDRFVLRLKTSGCRQSWQLLRERSAGCCFRTSAPPAGSSLSVWMIGATWHALQSFQTHSEDEGLHRCVRPALRGACGRVLTHQTRLGRLLRENLGHAAVQVNFYRTRPSASCCQSSRATSSKSGEGICNAFQNCCFSVEPEWTAEQNPRPCLCSRLCSGRFGGAVRETLFQVLAPTAPRGQPPRAQGKSRLCLNPQRLSPPLKRCRREDPGASQQRTRGRSLKTPSSHESHVRFLNLHAEMSSAPGMGATSTPLFFGSPACKWQFTRSEYRWKCNVRNTVVLQRIRQGAGLGWRFVKSQRHKHQKDSKPLRAGEKTWCSSTACCSFSGWRGTAYVSK